VVGAFPSVESYVRLMICYLVEYAEDCSSQRSYIGKGKIIGPMEKLHELMSQIAGLREFCNSYRENISINSHEFIHNGIKKLLRVGKL